MEHDLVRARVELKYRLSSSAARSLIADLKEAALPPDVRRQTSWITTVYLDTPDLRLARAGRSHPRTAVKLRLREYFEPDGSGGAGVVWVELKERDGERSRKDRFALEKARVRDFLEGALDEEEILRSRPSDAGEIAGTLRRIRDVWPGVLTPVGSVRYRRFSAQGGSPGARLTVDQEISYAAGPSSLREEGAVAEVKYPAGPTPGWCAALLGRRPACEYSKFAIVSGLALAETAVS
jgi:SPX domain protein involved in polyphosphate accumulation